MVITPISQMRKVRPREGLGCVQVTRGWGHLSGRTQCAMPMTQRDTGDEGRGAGVALGARQDVDPGVQDGGVTGGPGAGSGRRAPPPWVVRVRKLRQIPPGTGRHTQSLFPISVLGFLIHPTRAACGCGDSGPSRLPQALPGHGQDARPRGRRVWPRQAAVEERLGSVADSGDRGNEEAGERAGRGHGRTWPGLTGAQYPALARSPEQGCWDAGRCGLRAQQAALQQLSSSPSLSLPPSPPSRPHFFLPTPSLLP